MRTASEAAPMTRREAAVLLTLAPIVLAASPPKVDLEALRVAAIFAMSFT